MLNKHILKGQGKEGRFDDEIRLYLFIYSRIIFYTS